MVQFDTTATTTGWCNISAAFPNTPDRSTSGGTPDIDIIGSVPERGLLAFLMPQKPRGTDRINTILLTLTTRRVDGSGGTRTWQFYTTDKPWRSFDVSSGTATWNAYQTPGSLWNVAGGDTQILVGAQSVSGGYSSSFAADIRAIGSDWGDRFTVLVRDNNETGGAAGHFCFATYLTNGTVAWMPHITVRATDDPPAGINDLAVSPDLSLSEASYSFRQRAVVSWSASEADDFKRVRIRYGINRSQKDDHIHKAFVNSRASTTYLDPTLYTDGSTIYYSVYPEDFRNGSTSTALGATYTNVSNIVSWTKPAALIGRVSPSTGASTLESVEVNVRQTNDSAGMGSAMASFKKAKIVWADKSYSWTQTLTSAGGYAYARHRYTAATSGYTIRALVEDIKGFRSSLDSYGTSITIANLGPIAKIVGSPTRTFTAATYSFGLLEFTTPVNHSEGFVAWDEGTPAPASGIARSFRYNVVSTGSFTALLLRKEGAVYRVVYATPLTSGATVAGIYRREINWRVYKGDLVGIHSYAATYTDSVGTGYRIALGSTSTTVVPGRLFPKQRAVYVGRTPNAVVSYALTNPVHFSSKDSFARGSNRFINRLRWGPDYSGDFGAAGGATYTTGATTSFYWAWTTATTQFMAVRAIDDSHASSIDHIGVVVETEATFRIPDDLRDGMKHLADNRGRAYTNSPSLGMNYGTLDLGSIDPVVLSVSGESYSLATSTNDWIDIARLSAVFQQRKRVYIIPPWSTSTAVQGYVVDPPIVRDAGDPLVKKWSVKIAVAGDSATDFGGGGSPS